MFDKKVNDLLVNVDIETSNLIAQELARLLNKNTTSYLLNLFPTLSEIQKITIIQIGLYLDNKELDSFINKIVEDDNTELFFVKNAAKGVIEQKQTKDYGKNLKKIMERFKSQSDEDKIVDLSILGNKGNKELLSFLDTIKSSSKQVLEQRDIAKLQIISGIGEVINEYRSKNSTFSISGLRQALYVSLPNKESVQVIVEDLYKEDTETLIDTATIILYEPNFPSE
ncbi:hypothetical protein, partial [Niallia sp. 03133]|uniref:hypothetical protein n=1 Tax=Niallia sp. 03133 TaxID=3458060 RepID=UPI004043FE74